MPLPFLSLIFVNYQSVSLLERAIESWELPLQDFPHEIIVVNNDPDENQRISKLLSKTKITIKNLNQNVGFGKANNIGASLAQGEWLFLLNPDTEYAEGTVDSLLPIFETYPRSLGGIRLLTETGEEEPWSGGSFPTLLNLVKNHLFKTSQSTLWRTPIFSETDWVSGAALFVPRKSFQELNGFDEDFFLYFEDVDLARRAKRLGMSVWYTPTLAVRHKGGASQTNRESQKQIYYSSEERYFRKHRPPLESKLFTLLQRLLLS